MCKRCYKEHEGEVNVSPLYVKAQEENGIAKQKALTGRSGPQYYPCTALLKAAGTWLVALINIMLFQKGADV